MIKVTKILRYLPYLYVNIKRRQSTTNLACPKGIDLANKKRKIKMSY